MRIHDSGVTGEPDWYTALAALRTWSATHFYGVRGKNCSNYAETIRSHCTKFSFPGDLAPEFYSAPFCSTVLSQPTNHKSSRFLTVSLSDREGCMFDGVPVSISIRYSVLELSPITA